MDHYTTVNVAAMEIIAKKCLYWDQDVKPKYERVVKDEYWLNVPGADELKVEYIEQILFSIVKYYEDRIPNDPGLSINSCVYPGICIWLDKHYVRKEEKWKITTCMC